MKISSGFDIFGSLPFDYVYKVTLGYRDHKWRFNRTL